VARRELSAKPSAISRKAASPKNPLEDVHVQYVAHSSARAGDLPRGEHYRNTPNALHVGVRRLRAPPPPRRPRKRENVVGAKNAQGKEASTAATSEAAARPRTQDETARVFAEAVRLDKALEIDCYPDRQDLNLTLLKLARSAGTRVSLGTDAHHPWQLEFIQLGLAAALRARIPAERIVNFMSIQQIKGWIARLRERSADVWTQFQ
jgi:hypothetical protein